MVGSWPLKIEEKGRVEGNERVKGVRLFFFSLGLAGREEKLSKEKGEVRRSC